jgi:hypothetical protein
MLEDMRRAQVGYSFILFNPKLSISDTLFQAKLSFVSVLVDGDGMNVRHLISDMP